MVDVGQKATTSRTAIAEGRIRMAPAAFALVERNSGPKGDVMTAAELAGIGAAKRTGELIPLCHPLGLDVVRVVATLAPDLPGVAVTATAQATARTGVEMEALTAVTVALLTVYDMVKSEGYDLEIGSVHLVEKSGGKSGTWTRHETAHG
jgi:cyclic pyranopterin phosphate synthase